MEQKEKAMSKTRKLKLNRETLTKIVGGAVTPEARCEETGYSECLSWCYTACDPGCPRTQGCCDL
jgi:hypothetical protein